MEAAGKDQEMVRRYLLGLMSREESLPFEERLLTDGVLYEELLITEDELIDQYLSDDLSEPERQSIENHFLLSPSRQQKLRFAKSLTRYVTAESTRVQIAPNISDFRTTSHSWNFSFLKRHPAFTFATAAAVILVVTGSLILIQLRTPSRPEGVLTINLIPSGSRESGGLIKFAIPQGVTTVRFTVRLPDPSYSSYESRLESAEGQLIGTQHNLAPNSMQGVSILTVDVSPQELKSGDYRLRVSGRTSSGQVEPVATYPFRILRD